MENPAFIFTIFFLTLGPIKIVSAFNKLTHSMPLEFKRKVAIRGIFVATAVCLYVALLGQGIVKSYQLSIEGLGIAAGVILLLSALKVIFPSPQPPNASQAQPTAMQLAISPVASPIIVTPVGIAAILIFVLAAPSFPGMEFEIAKSLAILLVLDFLVMYFIDNIAKISWLMLALQVLGSVLIVIQVALAIEIVLDALRSLDVLKA